MTDRKPRRLWPLLTAALIGLPVLYVASFGPACWGVARRILPIGPTALIYDPLLRLSARDPVEMGEEPMQNWLYRYGWFCSESPDISGIERLAGERGFRGGGQFGAGGGTTPISFWESFWESSWDWLTTTAD